MLEILLLAFNKAMIHRSRLTWIKMHLWSEKRLGSSKTLFYLIGSDGRMENGEMQNPAVPAFIKPKE